MGRMIFDPNKPAGLSAETLARLDALTPEEIERNAETDLDNPPSTDEELAAMRLARTVRAVRDARCMSQAAFARTYRINPARLRDWEQGRRKPDSAALAYLETIRREPEAVARALSHMAAAE